MNKNFWHSYCKAKIVSGLDIPDIARTDCIEIVPNTIYRTTKKPPLGSQFGVLVPINRDRLARTLADQFRAPIVPSTLSPTRLCRVYLLSRSK